MLFFFFYGIQILFVIFIFYLCLAFVTGAPFVPSTNAVASQMIALSKIKKGVTVYDLGSGDGRLLMLAAKKGAKAIGFEINPLLVLFSTIRAFFSPYKKNITTQWKNFWSASLSQADIVYVYLLPWKMDTLEQKIQKECKKSTLIVSNSFIFPHLKKIQSDEQHHVYVFRIG